MAELLSNIKIREISFVDKGASGDEEDRPMVALYKRLDKPPRRSEMKVTKEITKMVHEAIRLQKMNMPEGAQALLETVKEKLSPEQWALIEMMLATASEGAPMKPAQEPSEAPASEGEKVVKADAPLEPAPSDMPKTETGPTSQTAEVKPLESAEGEPSEVEEDPKLEGQMAKIRKSHPEIASVLDVFAKRAETAETQVKSLTKKLKESNDRTAQEIEKRKLEAFEKMASTELSHIQGTPKDIAKRLSILEKSLSKEEFEAHVTMLKAASSALKESGAFAPEGSPGNHSGGAYEAMMAKAAELMKESKDLTIEQAVTKIMKSKNKDDRELAKRYRAEARNRN